MITRAVTVAALFLALAAGADARLCVPSKTATMWRHGGGTFKRTPGSAAEWREYSKENVPNDSKFRQVHVEGTSIIIQDDERNVQVLLREDLAGIRNVGEPQFQQLYQGEFVKVVDCTGSGQ
jgi:hypothetical protein